MMRFCVARSGWPIVLMVLAPLFSTPTLSQWPMSGLSGSCRVPGWRVCRVYGWFLYQTIGSASSGFGGFHQKAFVYQVFQVSGGRPVGCAGELPVLGIGNLPTDLQMRDNSVLAVI